MIVTAPGKLDLVYLPHDDEAEAPPALLKRTLAENKQGRANFITDELKTHRLV